MADSVDNHKLIVSLEARIRSYEKSIERSQKQTDQRMRGIETALKRPQAEMNKLGQAAERMERRLSKVGGVLKNFGAGLLGGIAAGGIASIVSQFGAVAKSVASIADEAKRAGVSTRVFQEWSHVAATARIPIDALVDGFKELNIRADEFATTGKGSAAEAFGRLGLSPGEIKERIKDPAEFMLLLIERTRQLKDTAAATRIFDELFGGTGAERLVNLLDQSSDSIRGTIDEAHRLGLVLDDDVIARAAEVDRQFQIVSRTVGAALKGAIVEAAGALQDFIASFQGFEAQRSGQLDANLAALGKERLDIEKQIGEVRARNDGMAGDGIFGTSFGDSGALGAIADYERRLESIAAEEQLILKALASRTAAVAPADSSSGWTPAAYTPPAAGGGRDKAAAQADREAEAVRNLIAQLEQELSLVGASKAELETANALRQAGAGATDEQRAKIAALISEINREEQALEALKRTEEAVREAGEFGIGLVGDALSSVIDKTAKAEDALKKLIVQLAIAAAQGALLGTGPLAGLFGGGGSFAGTAASSAIAGGGFVGLYHDGSPGVQPGNASSYRRVGPSALKGARRYHSGLKSFEMGAILKKGEAVLNEQQQGHAAGIIGGLAGAVRSGGGRMEVDVAVSVNDKGELQAYVLRTSQAVTGEGIRRYDKTSSQRFPRDARAAKTRGSI